MRRGDLARIVNASRRGEQVTVTTASGQKVTGTPQVSGNSASVGGVRLDRYSGATVTRR